MKLVRIAVASAALAGGVLVASATGASAAHCTDDGQPGNAGFAAHVQAANGNTAHNEGDHRGWSSCQPTSANFGG